MTTSANRVLIVEDDTAQSTTLCDLMRDAGIGERMDREGQIHEGFDIAYRGQRHRIDLAELTAGDTVMVSGKFSAQISSAPSRPPKLP